MADANDEVAIDFVAGLVSGGASIFCSQPIDTVLTLVQARSHSNPLPVANKFICNHGFSSLWRGSSAMIGAVPFQNAIMMAGYGFGKRWCELHKPDNILLGIFVGGCTAGVTQSFFMSPIELIKIKQQVIGRSFYSATSMVVHGAFSREIAWKGLGATLLRDGIPHGVWFASYEHSKNFLNGVEGMNLSKHSTAVPLVSGAVAAFTAWVVGYPFDIIKTRIQVSENRLTVLEATKDIFYESNGRLLSTFYRGFWMKIAKAVPASALNFLAYESVAKELRLSFS